MSGLDRATVEEWRDAWIVGDVNPRGVRLAEDWLRKDEALRRAVAFIDRMDMTYRYKEFLDGPDG